MNREAKQAETAKRADTTDTTDTADTADTTDTADTSASSDEPNPSSEVRVLTPSEQRVMRMVEETRSKPVPIPDNLRETLVKLQAHLEKSNTNPELLKTVKQDLTFFDEVVVKHRVSSGVCYKEHD